MPLTVPAVRRLASLLGIGLLVPGCLGSAKDAAKAERAIAEYDVARDAFHQGRLREALEHIRGALELDESNSDAAYLGAVTLLAFCAQDDASPDCRYKEAEDYCRQALESDPLMRVAQNTLAVILIHQRRYDEAIALLEPLSKDMLYASPENAWGNLGWAYFNQGRLDEAVVALKQSINVQPLFCVGAFRLGLVFEKKGDLPSAEAALSRALSTDRPECERMQEALEARGRVRRAAGRSTDAQLDFEQCAELAPMSATGRRCSEALVPELRPSPDLKTAPQLKAAPEGVQQGEKKP